MSEASFYNGWFENRLAAIRNLITRYKKSHGHSYNFNMGGVPDCKKKHKYPIIIAPPHRTRVEPASVLHKTTIRYMRCSAVNFT